MVDQTIDWNAAATVVQLAALGGHDGPKVMFEGSLIDALRSLRDLSNSQLNRLRVALPDSDRRPRSFEGAALHSLLSQKPPEKFGF